MQRKRFECATGIKGLVNSCLSGKNWRSWNISVRSENTRGVVFDPKLRHTVSQLPPPTGWNGTFLYLKHRLSVTNIFFSFLGFYSNKLLIWKKSFSPGEESYWRFVEITRIKNVVLVCVCALFNIGGSTSRLLCPTFGRNAWRSEAQCTWPNLS